jgi:thiamine biosynthesis lipoprotein
MAEEEVTRYEFAQPHMGTEFVLRVWAATKVEAELAAEAAFARIAELDGRLSDFQSESELSRLSRSSGSGEAVRVSDDLWNVLSAALRVSDLSEGALDVSVGPYVRLWRRARRTGQLPTSERLAQARAAVGYRFIEMDDAEQSVRLNRPNMRLDLGAIAKGYAADEALKVLRSHGITQALVAGGGDLAIGDPPPDESGWRVAIAPLRQESGNRGQGTESNSAKPQPHASTVLVLSNCGVSTSGDAYQFVEFEGVRFSHIVDPRTGMGVVGATSATIVAPDCTTSDALASAVSVLGPQKGIALIETQPCVSALVVVLENGEERRFHSRRMDDLVQK